MKQKKIMKSMLSIVLALALLVPTAWVPAENNATVAEAASSEVVYVSTNGSDSASGTEAQPVKTLAKAMELVTSGGTIQIQDTCETGSWSATGKTITITGGTLELLTVSNRITLGGLGDTLTFKNITLKTTDADEIFANGCNLTIGENVTWTGFICLFGGPQSGTLNGSTNLQVYSGDYERIYGGGNNKTTTKGNTNVIVGGNVCVDLNVKDHEGDRIFFGGGRGDTIKGSTNLTFEGNAKATYLHGGSNTGTIEKGSYINFAGGQAVGLYGGSRFGDHKSDAHVLMTGGTIEQIFGACHKEGLTGNVDVQVIGGTVTRRIYGGSYNEDSAEVYYSVTGNIKLTIGGDAQITFTGSSDKGIYARSRKSPKSDTEIGTIVFDDETAYNTYNAKLGAQDWGAEYVMGDVTAADAVHYFTYTADDETNTITATCNLCTEAHSATVTLSAIKNEFAYTGNAIEGAQIVYGENWNAAPLEIVYTNNVDAGTAIATCSKNGASVSVNFEIRSTVLSGKKISILGDSISTYEGVSNNANMNKTIEKNSVYYNTGEDKVLPTQNLTYWGQLVEKYGMEICVNNSWSGSKTMNYGTETSTPAIERCTELHNNEGEEPDIVLVYMGTNDLMDNKIVKFASAYEQMIDKILDKYKNAEVFCFTLLPGRDYATYETRIYEYNEKISEIVKGYEDRVHLVDMYTESGIAWNNLSTYTHDSVTLHPNATGMEKMAKVLERALLDVFEPASLLGTPGVYFDLDIDLENNVATDVGTNKANIQKVGNGSYTTKSVVYNGQTCEVPVFYASKNDKNGSGNDSYLDVAFNDITTAAQMESWILDKGITFEAFLWVENQPTQWSGIMSNISSGGIALHALATNDGNANFFIGTGDGKNEGTFWKTTYDGKTNYRYKGNYSTAAYKDNTKAYNLNTGTFVHVVGTYDNSTNMMSLYHNGQLIDSGIYAKPFKSGNITKFNHLGIGTGISATGESLDDTTAYAIADARVYSGGLTAEQVQQEYNNRWNEVLENATGPDVYFDLDFQEGKAVSVGTNKAKTTITQNGGNVTTMNVLHDGKICEVPVYSASKDTDKSKKAYLDVAFSDITTKNQMESWIFDSGISFECFIYVKELPSSTAGFMTNLNSGGIGLYSRNWRGELNFQLGTTDSESATYQFNANYVNAFPAPNAVKKDGKTANTVSKLQLAQNYQTLNVGKLTHVVGTYNAENNVMSIYKDGQLLGSGYYGDGEFNLGSASIGHLGLGCNIGYVSKGEWLNYFTDYAIADARVYSSALSAEQVAEQYGNRWNEVSSHAVSNVDKVDQLDDLSVYESITEGDFQELGSLPSYYYGSELVGTYEGSNTADRAVIDDNDHTLHVFSNTTPGAYVSYLKSLEADGWTQYSNNTIEENNLFATYTKDGKSVYAYYIVNKASTYIVVSDTDNLENRKADNEYKEICDPLFTELKNISSSQCEILRLSDGRFIIIDSGNTEKDHYQAKQIYEILEKQNVLDKITVAAWIITHPHQDHMNASTDFLQYYGSGDLDIEQIIFNYPNKTDRMATNSEEKLAEGTYSECNEPAVERFYASLGVAMEKWPEMKIITCHTGQEYYIADATIEILHTVEDYFPKKAEELTGMINDVSVAFKIKIAGQEIMILGDSGASASAELVNMWGNYLKSDFVQMSHHGMQGGSVELYEHIDPTVVTIPATRGLLNPDSADYIADYEATDWVLKNVSQNIKEVSIAGYGTRTFTLSYTPENENYISNINNNGYDMKEAEKVKTEIPTPYMDLVFDGGTVTDGGTADNTLEMKGGSVGENTVYYNGKPYTVTSYRGEKTSSNYNYIHLTMNDIRTTDDLKTLLMNGHTLEMFFALDNELLQIGGLMASCNSGGVALYARKLGVLGYQVGNTAGNVNTHYNANYAFAASRGTTNTCNIAVGKTVTHVVATYDKTEGMLKLYQNGVLISEGTYNNPEKYKGHADAYAEFFNQIGIGANVAVSHEAIGRETGYTVIKSRIYDQSLSADQVAAEYWSCIEDLTGDENIYDDWDPEKNDGVKKVTVPFTKTEVETFLSEGTYPTRKGYLFAGWYTTTEIPEIDPKDYDASAEKAMKVAIIDSVPDDVETVYALFVPEEVLTVKAQISGNLIDEKNDNDTTGSIRFVTTVDSLMYRQVGFKVEYKNSNGEQKTLTSVSNTVYEKLNAVDIEGKVVKELSYLPTQFCSVSKYFKACTVTNLSAKNFTREFTVTPFWVTMDGSCIYGEPVVKSIQQYLDMLK